MMKKENIQEIELFARELSDKNIKYRFIDERWQKRGDVDIIVAKDDIKRFETVIYQKDFKRKGKWPPQTRSYKGFVNDEIISLNAHVGGYIGGFGGGLGSLGQVLEPKDCSTDYLSVTQQLFILIYKYTSRKNKQKYEKEYHKLISQNPNLKELYELSKLAFKNPKSITRNIQKRTEISKIKVKFTLTQSFKLKFRGLPNKILRRIYKTIFPAPYLAIVGCNGTGKSTTTKNLVGKLIKENLQVAQIYSGRMQFQMLPINYFLTLLKPNKIEGKKIKRLEEDQTKGNKSKEEFAREVRIFDSPVLNFIAPFVYYLEYFLRYLIKVHPKRIFNDLVITDRGFIDLFISPNMNKKVCLFFFKILPKPKHILLHNDPEVLLERRPEFRIEDIKKQLKSYENLSKYYILKVKTNNLKIVDLIAKRVEELL